MVATQTRIGNFERGKAPPTPEEPPSDDELSDLIAPEHAFPFSVADVHGIEELRKDIREAVFGSEPIHKWSMILGNLVSYDTNKLSESVAILNGGGSATDCVNKGTSRCQVSEEDCYAVRTESYRKQVLSARRRERIVWTYLDPATFADAFRAHADRKQTPVEFLRLNQSGDFEYRQDIYKADEIARRLDIPVYTYTASAFLPWDEVTHLVVNASNEKIPAANRRFIVVDDIDEIPPGGVRCPHDASDGGIECGTACSVSTTRRAPTCT